MSFHHSQEYSLWFNLNFLFLWWKKKNFDNIIEEILWFTCLLQHRISFSCRSIEGFFSWNMDWLFKRLFRDFAILLGLHNIIIMAHNFIWRILWVYLWFFTILILLENDSKIAIFFFFFYWMVTQNFLSPQERRLIVCLTLIVFYRFKVYRCVG